MAIETIETTPKHQMQQTIETIQNQATTTTVGSDYEKLREQRIKENKERLQKLGISDLSLQVKSLVSASKRAFRTPRTPQRSPSVGPTEPRRRSSRLQNAPAVTYVEVKEEKLRRNGDIVLEVGSKPEFYTEEDEKLLGSTEMPWTFFVDGYRADGTRIYDPVNGKTCHQCRQKTMGKRTHCSKCKIVQGQFCGDCLYMRYGEHVVEANQNPNWICPPCRGICNCSLCRNAKGWAPTGALYRRISNLGYKSVAHYLMATKRAPPPDDISDAEKSAKRSLPFDGMEVPSDNSSDAGALVVKTDVSSRPDDDAKSVRSRKRKTEIENGNDGEDSVKRIEDTVGDAVPYVRTPPKGVGRSRKRSKIYDIGAGKNSVTRYGNADESAPEMKDGDSLSPNSDSVSRSLRPHRSPMDNVGAGKDSEIKDEKTDESALEMKGGDSLSPNIDSVGGKLRSRNKLTMDNRGAVQESESKDGKLYKPVSETEVADPSSPNTDSVAKRLRSRNRSLVNNADAGEESEVKDGKKEEPVPEMKGRDSASPNTDSVARRLRSRNRT